MPVVYTRGLCVYSRLVRVCSIEPVKTCKVYHDILWLLHVSSMWVIWTNSMPRQKFVTPTQRLWPGCNLVEGWKLQVPTTPFVSPRAIRNEVSIHTCGQLENLKLKPWGKQMEEAVTLITLQFSCPCGWAQTASLQRSSSSALLLRHNWSPFLALGWVS